MDEIEDENDGWSKVTENQTNHVVATGFNRHQSGSRNVIYYIIMVVENDKDLLKITVHNKLNISWK